MAASLVANSKCPENVRKGKFRAWLVVASGQCHLCSRLDWFLDHRALLCCVFAVSTLSPM